MEYYEQVKKLVTGRNLAKAISFCETELNKFKPTPFHWVVGKDMLHLADDLFAFIKTNFADREELDKTRAFYSELNGFSINWDKWFLDITAFDKIDDFQNEGSDWLSDGFWGSENPEYFEIKGWKPLQNAFKDYHEGEKFMDKQLSLVSELTEFLVVLRLQQLFEKVIIKGRGHGLKWGSIPWGITAHDYSLIYEIRS